MAEEPAVEQEHVREPVDHAGHREADSPSLEDVPALPVRDDRLVVALHEVDPRGGQRAAPTLAEPELTAVHAPVLELRCGDLQTATRIRHRETRPPREVAQRRRAAGGEESHRELGQRLVPSWARPRRHALVERRVRVLLAPHRSAAHDAGELGVHHDVREPLPVGGDAATLERVSELTARAMTAGNRRCDLIVRPVQDPAVELEVAIAARIRGIDARAAQLDQPAKVGGRDVVPRRPQHVRAQEAAVVERVVDLGRVRPPRALAHGPPRVPMLLRLHRGQPGDRLVRRVVAGSPDALPAHPDPCDGCCIQAPSLTASDAPRIGTLTPT